jgi:hypothetical protein
MNVTPHLVQHMKRSGGSAIDERTTRHGGYGVSQKKRKRIEECFGWLKTIARMRKVRHRGLEKVAWVFTFAGRGLQPGKDEKSTGQLSWRRISQGRSVSANGRGGQKRPRLLARRCLKCSSEATHVVSSIVRVADLAENVRFSAAC